MKNFYKSVTDERLIIDVVAPDLIFGSPISCVSNTISAFFARAVLGWAVNNTVFIPTDFPTSKRSPISVVIP